MTDQEKLIWMAGFFDGEGCVSISRSQRKVKRGLTSYSYILQVAVSQKNAAPLEIFYERFGGSLFDYTSHGVTYWRWQLWSNYAAPMLETLLPYLVVKKDVAELGLRFYRTMKAQHELYRQTQDGERDHLGYLTGTVYSNEEMAIREEFYQQARKLNARNRANYREPKYAGPQFDKLRVKTSPNTEELVQ
jgi:LAGLIDADG endonuclease